jgi:2-oxoglutarate/2-oxoacid ferredoxin oxidoreductase subunit beta
LEHGSPLKISEIFGQIEGAAYVERVSLHDIPILEKLKKLLKKHLLIK